ncbi:MAG TPA: hypothetical protein VJL58_01005, partial [Pyrinomonadaceae bacterium]|nr:hypothetical protein [Pyrinomonadaceae bacterium]
MDETNRKASSVWIYAAVPTLIMVFLALYPQINIWIAKGSAWNGSFVVSNYDEVAYSAYVNSLIEGRPRTNDPFLGRDDVPTESLYSIQVIPAYTIAYMAKMLGLSASGAFVLLNLLVPLFASLAIFALIRAVTKDNLLSAVGLLIVLCLGAAIAFEGELQHRILQNYLCDFFPFLRRYQPGFAFPIFFGFLLLVWKMLTETVTGKALGIAAAAGAVFAVLVFSYFFLWTAAFAWLGCFALLWFVLRRDDRRNVLVRTSIVALFGIAAFVPYFLLLANRPQNMDDTQLLSFTRAPNLFEISEIVGLLVIATLLFAAGKGRIALNSPPIVFTLSLAATPFILFNQQVVTGRSLQPVHYEIFIANYLALLALVLLAWNICVAMFGSEAPARMKRGLIYIGLAAVIWGFVESTATTRRNAAYESLRDDAMPALQYLSDQAKANPPINGRYAT